MIAKIKEGIVLGIGIAIGSTLVQIAITLVMVTLSRLFAGPML